MSETPKPAPARVLAIDLEGLEQRSSSPSVADWTPSDPALGHLAAWGGSALAIAIFVERAREGREGVPLVLAVGNAVRRGIPTAARMTLASRGVLTGRYSEGQVGGDCSFRLAAIADALVLEGVTSLPGAVLEIDPVGRLQLHGLEELVGLSASETRRALTARFGSAAALYVGPAGERGVRFATLISGLDHASHVGRGGLGAVFGGLGLKAVVFTGAQPALPRADSASRSEILGALIQSPRLRARAEGGTHELWSAFQARGELRGVNYSTQLSNEAANQLWSESREAAGERRGCPGCPTPCGLVVEAGGGKQRSGPRFGAAWALGPNLGFKHLDSAMHLFETCDEVGIDAKETGAVLALAMRAREGGQGSEAADLDVEEFAQQTIAGFIADPISTPARGAVALARELKLEDELFAIRGQAARPDHDFASLLGQCVSSNGADPMRTFPFASGDGLDRDRMQQLMGELELPNGVEDSSDPTGVGRLVWWHENFVAAVDASGFCSFSAGSLVSDNVIDLQQLRGWLSPAELSGEAGANALLELGALVVWYRGELANLWKSNEADEWPTWARETLERPGVLDEYQLARGLGADGLPVERARDAMKANALFAFGCDAMARRDRESGSSSGDSQSSTVEEATSLGRVQLRTSGPLGDRLGGSVELELPVPARVESVLRALSDERPEARAVLFVQDRAIAAVYREAKLLTPADLVRAGDVLDIVVAVSGG